MNSCSMPLGGARNALAQIALLIFRITCLLVLSVALFAPKTGWLLAALVVMLYVILVHRGLAVVFDLTANSFPKMPPRPNTAAAEPRLAIIVPVRNEALGIAATLRSIYASPGHPEVLVVNDGSTDATAEIVTQLVHEHSGLRLLTVESLPPNWIGKTHAVWLGFLESREDAEWLLFLDARTLLDPGLALDAIALAEKEKFDLLSCLPRFMGDSWIEQWAGIFATRGLFLHLRLDRLNDPDVPPLGVFGAFLLVRRSVYQLSGGHSAAPENPIDDMALAETVRKAGGKIAVVLAGDRLRRRRYSGFGDMRPRIIRGLRVNSGDSALTLVSGLVLETVIYVAPLVVSGVELGIGLQGRSNGWTLLLLGCSVAAYVAASLGLKVTSQLCECSAGARWLHPLGAAVRILFRIEALLQKACLKPVSWRGRPVPA